MAHILLAARAMRLRGSRVLSVLGGPGALVAVGYVDPGNWATDLAGGSRYAYSLLSVVVAAGLAGMVFQSLSARLGIATNRDLAVLTREAYPRAAWVMWGAAEIGVLATDLAEVLGSAIALQLLFHLPLTAGVLLTGLDVGVLLAAGGKGSALLQRVVSVSFLLIAGAFAYELVLARPDLAALAGGLVPTTRLVREPGMLFAAIGILGATVMPHNLYLHSSLVRRRGGREPHEMRGEAARASRDTVASLAAAMVMNGALVVLSAAVFNASGRADVADLREAHRLLAPLLGSAAAPVLFALALLAAGQSATITGTLAGQVVMSGFLDIRWAAWKRRLVTRACAIVPAIAVLVACGESSVGPLLVLSQVVLSLTLPFAIVPLVRLAADRACMGALAIPAPVRVVGWTLAAAIVCANAALVVTSLP